MDDWMPSLVNLGGAVVVTGLFLYYLLKREEKIEPVINNMMTQMKAIETNFREHNKHLTDDFSATVKEQNTQMKTLMVDHISVTKETIKAVTELKGSVDILRVELGKKQDRIA